MSETSGWNRLVEENAVVRFVDINLRGTGQVMFQNNPITGLFFLAGIFWGAIAAGMVQVAIGAVVALVVATITAVLLRVDKASLRSGLYGFNGILVGAALPTFLKNDPMLWAYLIIGAAVSTVAMLAIANVFKTWGVAALTFPFVLVTWFLLLGSYELARVPIASMGPPALPKVIELSAAHAVLTGEFLFRVLFVGVSQVFFINNVVTGILFVVGLALSSRAAAVFALVGSAVAMATALAFGAGAGSIHAGLYGFSAVLTAIALGSVFYQPSLSVTLYAVLGTVFTVFVQAALNVFLTPVGIPTLTAPFCFAAWVFLLPKEKFVPLHNERAVGGVTTGK